MKLLQADILEGAVPNLATEFESDSLIINGVATTSSGRRFFVIQPQTADQPQVAEFTRGTVEPYPNQHWNRWRAGDDPGGAFVGVNSLRVGPDAALWIVDRGAAGIGSTAVPHGPKLVRIDLDTNRPTRIYDLTPVAPATSFVDDVRFNGRHAYLTDAGRPALILLDLESGRARRVLESHPSTVATRPLRAEGRPLLDRAGKPIVIHADQLELPKDGRWLYYQPCSGPMSRIETKYLDDESLSADELASHVESFSDTHSTGGTAIDSEGTIYISDTDHSRILKVTPDGRTSTLIGDPRLAWVDAMWIDDGGMLWMPAAQLNRLAGLNHGREAVKWPMRVYSIQLGVKAVRR
jgi:hypothetical protein